MKKNTIAVLFLLIASTVCGYADETDRTLLLGTVDNFPPFTYRVNGELTGIDIDLINEMEKRIGISVEIKAYPWIRVMESVKRGIIDGGFAAFRTKEREEFCLYTECLHYEEFYLFVRKGNEFRYSGISNLYGKTIGKDRGVFVSDEFEKAVKEKKIRLEEVNDMNMLNIKKLNAGRLDAAIGDLGVMVYYARSLGLEKKIVPLSPVGKKTAAYLVISKAAPLRNKADLQYKIQTVLQQMREDGTYQKIYDRHVIEGR